MGRNHTIAKQEALQFLSGTKLAGINKRHSEEGEEEEDEKNRRKTSKSGKDPARNRQEK